MSEENMTPSTNLDEIKIKSSEAVSSIANQTNQRIESNDSIHPLDANSLQNHTLEELIKIGNELMVQTPTLASKHFIPIKKAFFDKYNTLKDEAFEIYKAEITELDPPVFEFSKKPLIQDIKSIENKIKQAQEEEKERVELEKKKNLKLKHELLAQLEDIVNQDETLDTINDVRKIQKKWKSIRVLPKESVQELWEKYNLLQHKFYDNHSINIELKELDRQKNLAYKIELTQKVEALANEKSIKKCFIMLNKYHEEFKNTGPVPRESNEPIWEAFKKASDAIHDIKQQEIDQIENQKKDNLKKKEILLEKAILLNAVEPRTPKEWASKSKQFEELFVDWKKIGPVPKSNKEAVWINFNGNRNSFFKQKKAFFDTLNSAKKENLILKEKLCEQVELLKTSTDWAKTSKKIIQIQTDWKKIGPVPEKSNQQIWKRFRSACDFFFEAKNKANSERNQSEKDNLSKKENIINQLQTLASGDIEYKTAFKTLKKLNAQWRSIGFIPRNKINSTHKAYDKASNAVYQKYSKQIEEARASNLTEHFTEILSTSNGQLALKKEELFIKKKLNNLSEEISGIETNMSFFASSKNADEMLKDFEQKIQKNKKYIERLKKELSTLNQVRKKHTKSLPQNATTEH